MSKLSSFNRVNRQVTTANTKSAVQPRNNVSSVFKPFGNTNKNHGGNGNGMGNGNGGGGGSGNIYGGGNGMGRNSGFGAQVSSNHNITVSVSNNGSDIPDPSANVTNLGHIKISQKRIGFGLQTSNQKMRRRGGLIRKSNPEPNTNQGPLESDVSFPIDLVYTWVNGSDEEWIKSRNQYLATQKNIPEDSLLACRWRDFDELRVSIESAYLFAPWLRQIFIITDQQRPWWFDESNPGKIVFIDHVELFGQEFEEFLPTFNSHALETVLHRIPDLAEHFIYANDDCFFGNYVKPTDFFTPDGRFKLFLTNDDLETEQSLKSSLQQAKKSQTFVKSGGKMTLIKNNKNFSSSNTGNNNNNNNHASQNAESGENLFLLPYFTAQARVNSALDQVLGKSPIARKRLKHQMKALRITTFEKCWEHEILQESLFSTMSTRFRSLTDIDPVTMISHVGLVLGEGVPGTISSKYYALVDDALHVKKVFYHLLKFSPPPKIFCLNDDMKNPDQKLFDVVKEGLGTCLPHQKILSSAPHNQYLEQDPETQNQPAMYTQDAAGNFVTTGYRS